jgi:hypothetical protein
MFKVRTEQYKGHNITLYPHKQPQNHHGLYKRICPCIADLNPEHQVFSCDSVHNAASISQCRNLLGDFIAFSQTSINGTSAVCLEDGDWCCVSWSEKITAPYLTTANGLGS